MDYPTLGDRMKAYEARGEFHLLPGVPVIARLDGRAFHTFTKNLERPYDKRLSDLMIATAKFMAEQTQADIAYTQSDEITLAWHPIDLGSHFNGRIVKMASVMASQATAFFNQNNPFTEQASLCPHFDCRVWNVPNASEAINVLIWRELDATKNSIFSAANSFYSHKELLNKKGDEMQEMLFQKGVNWNNYPAFFKRGTYIKRTEIVRKFTAEELAALPEKHNARSDPDAVYTRSEYRVMDWPPILKMLDDAKTSGIGKQAKEVFFFSKIGEEK